MNERRRFNSNEHVALYLASDGKCTACGVDLAPGWHADHMHPHSKAGATDVVNGQALCPGCNLRKGSSTSMTQQLSAWQQEAMRKYRLGSGDFLAVACPGAGKTRFALAAAADSLELSYRQVVVVVPTSHLRKQWADQAAQFGIQLDPTFENRNGTTAPDFDGVAVTYSAVGSQPLLFRRMVDQQTLVIFDEIHHAGDDASWGRDLRRAFEAAGRRLLLSGTPRRTDGTEIPFVTYDEEGNFEYDHLYGYGEAIQDSRTDEDGRSYPVVRGVEFQTHDGSARWMTAGEAEVTIEVNLKDANDATMSNALRSALDPSGDWIESIFVKADQTLTAKRAHVPDAGGLVVAGDQFRARKYTKMLERISGEQVTLAISDEPQASAAIADYAQGSGRWVVAVQMISEGVDIPRLAVGVYATNTRTELFFRQVIGRIIRSRGVDDLRSATMFIPCVEPLVKFASEIEATVTNALKLKDEREERERLTSTNERPEVVVLGSSEARYYSTISGGQEFTGEELARAEMMIAANGFPQDTSPMTMASFLRNIGIGTQQVREVPGETAVPLSEQKRQLREDIKTLVGKVAYHCYGDPRKSGDVNYDLRAAGFPSRDKASLEELEAIKAHLARCLSDGTQVA